MVNSEINLRSFRNTDLDFVVSRQLALYETEYGFTSEIWKKYLTDGVSTFIQRFDPEKDAMFILEDKSIPSGCVAVMHLDDTTAQLRFFFLEADIRGRGAGRLLMDRAVDFCREKNYGRIFLWTFSTLLAARHLYASKGFRITDTHMNPDWGSPVLEERWDLIL